jgi:hypothetical protein
MGRAFAGIPGSTTSGTETGLVVLAVTNASLDLFKLEEPEPDASAGE